MAVFPRDRVLTTLFHKELDKVPKYIRFTPEMKVEVFEKIGTDNYEDYFGIEFVGWGFKPTKKLSEILFNWNV